MANCIILTGRLTADPELKTTPGGTSVCSFRIAFNREFKTDEAVFVNIKSFSKTAEFVTKYFTKGKLIEVQGYLDSDNYTTKEGEQRRGYAIHADKVNFVGTKADNERAAAPAAPAEPAPQSSPAKSAWTPPTPEQPSFDVIGDDDLPF